MLRNRYISFTLAFLLIGFFAGCAGSFKKSRYAGTDPAYVVDDVKSNKTLGEMIYVFDLSGVDYFSHFSVGEFTYALQKSIINSKFFDQSDPNAKIDERKDLEQSGLKGWVLKSRVMNERCSLGMTLQCTISVKYSLYNEYKQVFESSPESTGSAGLSDSPQPDRRKAIAIGRAAKDNIRKFLMELEKHTSQQ